MSVLADLIKDRRTVHSYLPEEISPQVLNKGLELALWAPNHHLTKPWKFVCLRGSARTRLGEIVVSLKERKEKLTDIKKTALIKKYATEGSLVFFAQKLNSDPKVLQEDYATLACSIQNFSLYMHEQGLGTKWSSGALLEAAETYGLLGLSAKDYKLVGMIWVGKYSQKPAAPERGELSDYLSVIEDPL